MKRFWTDSDVFEDGGGWGIRLDGRPVRTPARSALIVPTRALADAIADEWTSVEGEIDPRAMPLTGLANAAIDRIASHKDAFAQSLASYAEADLTCYRAEGPSELIERQSQSWDAVIAWARRRYDVDFAITSGLMHQPQPPATLERLSHALAALGSFELAGLSPLVTISGSLVIALAVLENGLTAEQAWTAAIVDDQWQLEQWGEDEAAVEAVGSRRRDFFAAARFLDLLKS